MKKILSMAAIALFMAMTSCSGDDDADTQTVLLKKTIETGQFGSLTINYIYNGNKIESIIEGNDIRTDFTYTGDLITQIDYYLYYAQTHQRRDILGYNSNNQLISRVELFYGDNSYAGKYLYTYNADGTVTENRFAGELEDQSLPAGSSIITVNNGNVISRDDMVWTYDDKNNPLSNILGWNALNIAYNGGVNNVIRKTYTMGDTFDTTYTYDENNYPITSGFNPGGGSGIDGYQSTTQYFYETISN